MHAQASRPYPPTPHSRPVLRWYTRTTTAASPSTLLLPTPSPTHRQRSKPESRGKTASRSPVATVACAATSSGMRGCEWAFGGGVYPLRAGMRLLASAERSAVRSSSRLMVRGGLPPRSLQYLISLQPTVHFHHFSWKQLPWSRAGLTPPHRLTLTLTLHHRAPRNLTLHPHSSPVGLTSPPTMCCHHPHLTLHPHSSIVLTQPPLPPHHLSQLYSGGDAKSAHEEPTAATHAPPPAAAPTTALPTRARGRVGRGRGRGRRSGTTPTPGRCSRAPHGRGLPSLLSRSGMRWGARGGSRRGSHPRSTPQDSAG